jgi:hypothetical protein
MCVERRPVARARRAAPPRGARRRPSGPHAAVAPLASRRTPFAGLRARGRAPDLAIGSPPAPRRRAPPQPPQLPARARAGVRFRAAVPPPSFALPPRPAGAAASAAGPDRGAPVGRSPAWPRRAPRAVR